MGLPDWRALESPVSQAEQLLGEARRSGDRRREASALTVLGVILTGQGSAQRAVGFLQDARALSRQLADPSLETDVPAGTKRRRPSLRARLA